MAKKRKRKHKKYIVNLSSKERKSLGKFIASGKKSAREINRARILLLADEDYNDEKICNVVKVSRTTVYSIRKKYCEEGYDNILEVLKDVPRKGAPIKVDSDAEAKVVMIACSDPPEGQVKWTLRLVADKMVELGYIDSISHETVRTILKKTN